MDAKNKNYFTIRYDEVLDRMEMRDEFGYFETYYVVPPDMKEGDYLTPFVFKCFEEHADFYLFGRYNDKRDTAEYVMTGPPGYHFKMSFSDQGTPYSWKVKKHSMTRSYATKVGLADRLIGQFIHSFLAMSGATVSKNFLQDIIAANAYLTEEVISVPMSMMRLSCAGRGFAQEQHANILDAKQKAVQKWCFFGPSMPKSFCRCRMKVRIYNVHEKQVTYGKENRLLKKALLPPWERSSAVKARSAVSVPASVPEVVNTICKLPSEPPVCIPISVAASEAKSKPTTNPEAALTTNKGSAVLNPSIKC